MHQLGLQSRRKISERCTVDGVWGQRHSSGRSASSSAEDLSSPREARGATKQSRASEIYVPEETKNSSTKEEARKPCPSFSSTESPASAISSSTSTRNSFAVSRAAVPSRRSDAGTLEFRSVRLVHLAPSLHSQGAIMASVEVSGGGLLEKDVQTISGGRQTDHAAAIIDGKVIADHIRKESADEVAKMKDAVGNVPGLAMILVGSRKDSSTYVRMKKKSCLEVGIQSFDVTLPEDTTEEIILGHIKEFNDNPAIHGILVQLPLPKHINEERVLGAVSYEKDVDGFHPINLGTLAMQGRKPLFVCCTPKGCIELLKRSGVQMSGKRAVVLGRSNIVGTPAALLLQRENATVTVVHSRTPNPAEITREADIVVAAVGKAELVRGDWLKPGCVVIDVGINAVEDSSRKTGYRLVGDVCYKEASQVASKITPVPGGVGPMTIAMLLTNTIHAAKRAYGLA